eukprot:2261865-Pyramimonas_sp.AAC.1
MLHAASPWTDEMDAFVRGLPTGEARAVARRRQGGSAVGYRPWNLPFEIVGGAYWYCNVLWDEYAWKHFARTVLGVWELTHILGYFALKDPKGPWSEVREDATEEARKRNKEAEKERISKRLQYNNDHQTSWNHAAPGMPLEILGDSLVVCNWIN